MNLDQNFVELQSLSHDKGRPNLGALWYAKRNGISQNTCYPIPFEYKPKYLLENINCTKLIAEGRFSSVWKACVRGSGYGAYAVKQYSSSRVQASMILRERDFLIYLKHRRICNIFGAFYENSVFLVLELCCCDLKTAIPQLDALNKLRFGIQLGQALIWIHRKNVIHADLRPECCLITTSNNLVLSHFRNAIKLKDDLEAVKLKESTGYFGYQDYESNKYLIYSKKSDMFSFGCVLYDIICEDYLLLYPFKEVNAKEYAKAYKLGRIVDLGTRTITENMKREMLYNRVMRAGKFGIVLTRLIACRQDRPSVEDFMECKELTSFINVAHLDVISLDCVDERSEQVNFTERTRTFRNKKYAQTGTKLLELSQVYYDEEEEIFYRPRPDVQTYATHGIARIICRNIDGSSKLIRSLALGNSVVEQIGDEHPLIVFENIYRELQQRHQVDEDSYEVL